MSSTDELYETRKADKAQALGEIAAVLAMIDAEHREPDAWERLSLLRAFSLVSSGCYLLATLEARDASLRPDVPMDERAAEPVLERCDLLTMFEALKEAMAEEARPYPHLGPTALG
ncbi:hypothetical protein RHAL1_03433 [Beijerinckiaceae bacterium RH AL1]|jgi:hypothetical protein|nr:hypothetical protein [Beijerinckiaceae bacterium]VVB48659.1 hypothetical protein RHCH11_RHCH11_03367 [Beijerinckiaceae bacterium RH CH11]VVB48741.1 hypothetical protein RHAL8_03363 [Beijerinckiaceae bacterium RH AL8]VVC56505.1 hypothetical protein RHAL1_03433 [Beijerinckiaceae bacterium RH AL1]